MKKITLGTVSLISMIAPLTAVIACGETKQEEKNKDTNNPTNNDQNEAKQIQEITKHLEAAKTFLTQTKITKKSKLPSSYKNVNQNDVLKRIFDLEQKPKELNNIAIENVVIKPSKDDQKGSLSVEFDLKEKKQTVHFSRTIDKYENKNEYQDTLDREAIKKLDESLVQTWITDKTIDNMHKKDEFQDFEDGNIISEPSELSKIYSLLGINLSKEKGFENMKIKSIKYIKIIPRVENNEKLYNGYVSVQINIKKGNVEEPIKIFIYG